MLYYSHGIVERGALGSNCTYYIIMLLYSFTLSSYDVLYSIKNYSARKLYDRWVAISDPNSGFPPYE